jgi:hypothetical protein
MGLGVLGSGAMQSYTEQLEVAGKIPKVISSFVLGNDQKI